VPLIAVVSKCIRQENEIDESNVSKEDMKDEYNETIADVDDGTSPVTFEVNMRIMEYFSLFYLKSHENIPLKNYN
jgi:hypothetical protein